MSVFKSYLRKLLKDLKDIDEATPDNELTQKAKELLHQLIDETQLDIEDN